MKPTFKRILISLSLLLLLSLTFVGGIYTGQNGLSLNGETVQADTAASSVQVFEEALNLIENRFIDRNDINSAELTYAAIAAMTDALGDTGHTRFMTPEEANSHEESIQGRFFGIGAYIGVDEEGRPMITSPIRNTPAERAGVRAGDLILAVDGEDVTEYSIEEIVTRIKGEKGTEVQLTVLHKDETEPVTLPIVRDEINIPSVEWAFVPDSSIAHIYLGSFSASASEELISALTEAQTQGATGIIMDVRNNSGGLLEQAIRVTSQFVGEGNVLQREDADGNRQEYPAREGGVALEIPVVVLVNEFSASSTEIFAGAIQDRQRGVVMGTTTFGTGTVLTPYTLSDGSVLLLGTSQWLTADGRALRNQGITPDVQVELPEDSGFLLPLDVEGMTRLEIFSAGDTQFYKAWQYLNRCIKTDSCRP